MHAKTKWTSRMFVPVTLLLIASLLAIFASRPLPPTSESAAASTVLSAPLTIDTVIDPEALPHDHGSTAGEIDVDHAHVASTSDSAVHSHGTTDATIGTISDGHTHTAPDSATAPTGPIVSIDDPRLSSAQQSAARRLLTESRAGIAAHPTTAALSTEGYVPVGDNSGGLSHWVNDEYTHDGRELDANRIETYMVQITTGRVVGAMYMLEPGKTMANVPNIAGELTTWHVHAPICFSTAQIWRYVSFAKNRNCPAGSAVRDVPPMIHVWADDPACGPFVGTEGHGTTTCGNHSH